MIIDIACIRNRSDDLVNGLIFEYRMKRKGVAAAKKESIKFFKTGAILIAPKTSVGGIYSYEMMHYAMSTGDFVNALTFGLLPVLQGLDINNVKMMNTYIKDKIAI